MEPTVMQHEHAHTPLGIRRTNAASIQWAAILTFLAAVANGLEVAISKGLLVPPPAIAADWVYVTFVCDIIIILAAALGVSSYHPGLPMDQLHAGPIEHHE